MSIHFLNVFIYKGRNRLGMVDFHNYIEICTAFEIHAQSDYPLTAPMLEGLYGLSARKTEAIIRKLVKGGVIDSIRGHYGGYYIDSKKNITFYDIYMVYKNDATVKPPILKQLSGPIMAQLSDIENNHYIEALKKVKLSSFAKEYNNMQLPKRDCQELVYYI